MATVPELSVWLRADQVGTLSLDGGQLRFRYRPEWLARADAKALSYSLPLQEAEFNDSRARPFFAGLLPEGDLRRLIARHFQVSNRNDFALLKHIGGECAGAVSLLPHGLTPESAGPADVQWLDDQELAAVLSELPRRPMLAGDEGLRLSLAGAQDKLPVVFDGEGVGLPRGDQASTHILKPAIQGVDDSVVNEAFCLSLATSLGLAAASAEIFARAGHTVLLVSRYDRRRDQQNRVVRLHQEDFCQALGVIPEMKYQNEGGPDFAACFALLRRVTRPSAPQVLRLLDYVVFNALIGNHDAHAKNFSLLQDGESRLLAPLYDVLSTAVYPALTPKMAMKIGGKYRFSEVHARHWAAFAENAGLAPAQTRKRVLALAETLPHAARKLQSRMLYKDNALVGRIVELIDQRTTWTIRRLTSVKG